MGGRDPAAELRRERQRRRARCRRDRRRHHQRFARAPVRVRLARAAPSPTAFRARTVLGTLSVDTRRFPEGTQGLVVQAHDTAGNVGNSPAVTARIDNTPPARVDVAVEGGEAWRNTNDFVVAWTNPPEGDRAPIAGAGYKLCAAGAGSCTPRTASRRATSRGSASRLRRRASGRCRCGDGMPPATRPRRRRRCRSRCATTPSRRSWGSSRRPPADPTLVAVAVTDRVSGLASGSIEISPSGSGSLAGAADAEVGKPTGRPDRRRRASRGQLRAASARRRPGAQRGVDRSPARRPADDAHAAAADRVDDAGGLRAHPHGAGRRSAGTASACESGARSPC